MVQVARTSRLHPGTISKGIAELVEGAPVSERVRAPGGGRKPLTATDPGLLGALEELVDPDTRGDPMSPLRWTCKSTRQLAGALTEQGHPVSHVVVGELLRAQGYSLQPTTRPRLPPPMIVNGSGKPTHICHAYSLG